MIRKFIVGILALSVVTPVIYAHDMTCFQPKSANNLNVPEKICLSGIYYDFNKRTAVVGGSELLKEMKYVAEIPRADDYSVINLSAVIREYNGSVCGDRQVLRVNLVALFEPMGFGLNESIKLNVENESTNDWCHSEPEIEIIEYVRIK